MTWRRLSALFFFSSLIEAMAWGHLIAFTPILLERDLGVQVGDVPRLTGLLAASTLGLALPFAPFWGVLAARYGRAPLLARSLIVEVIGFALIAFAPDLTTFFAARLLLGLSFGNVAVKTAALSLVTPVAHMGTAIAMAQAAMPIGHSIGPLFGGLLATSIGLRGVFALDAVLLAGGLVLVLALYRDSPDRNSEPLGRQLQDTFQVVSKTPTVRGIFLAAFLLWFGSFMLEPFVPVRLIELHRAAGEPWLAPAAFVGVVLAAFGTITGLATPVMGQLADRFGRWRFLTISLLCLALSALGLALAPDLAVFVGTFLIRALPQAVTIGIVFALLAGELPRQHRSAVMALVPLPRAVAGVAAPLAAAGLTVWGVPAIFAVSGAVLLVAWGASRRVAPRLPQPSLSP